MNEMPVALAIIGLLKEMGGWSIGTIVIVIFLIPPLLGFFSVRSVIKAFQSLEERTIASDAKTELLFITMTQKYENNIEFVKNYEKLVRNHQAIADGLLDIIKENTTAVTLAAARIESMQGRGH